MIQTFITELPLKKMPILFVILRHKGQKNYDFL